MARFEVGDRVIPVCYDKLVYCGYVSNGADISGISSRTYRSMCEGKAHFIESVDDSGPYDTSYKVRYVDPFGHTDWWWVPEWALEHAVPKCMIPEVPKFCFPMTLHILGTEYRVEVVDNFGDESDDRTAGYTDPDMHLIQLRDLSTMAEWKKETVEKIEARQKEILRHEIVHAYLNESGLKYNSFVFGDEWAHNEEMVDWFAIQGPKIMETWQKAGCL